MLRAITFLSVNVLILLILDFFLGNLSVNNFFSAAFFFIILTALQWSIIPVLQLMTLPISILTFGLASFLISLFGMSLTFWLVPGITIEGDFFTQFFTLILISVSLFLGQNFIQSYLGKR